MSLTPMLAREFRFALNTGTDAAPNLVPIGGITTFSLGSDSERTDDTDFDSAGWAQGKTVSRSRSITLEGNYEEDPDDAFSQDPGQEALIVLGDAVGYSSTKSLIMRYPSGKLVTQRVDAKVTAGGGGNNDNASFSAELTVSGKPQTLTSGLVFDAAGTLWAEFTPGGQVDGGTTAGG